MDKHQQDKNYQFGYNVYQCHTYNGMKYILIQDENFNLAGKRKTQVSFTQVQKELVTSANKK